MELELENLCVTRIFNSKGSMLRHVKNTDLIMLNCLKILYMFSLGFSSKDLGIKVAKH